MSTYINTLLFGIYPYIAIVTMILGSILRYDQNPYSWKADSSQLLSRKGLRWGSNLFHVGILLLFFGHLVGLLTPHWAYDPFISAGDKQLVAMVAGGIFGSMSLVGMIILIWRRVGNTRIRATTKPMDMAILLILFVQMLLGLATIPFSAQHLDGSSMIALASWAQSIVTFQPGAAQFIAGEAIVFKLHIFLGLTIFLLFPFTRLVHMFSVPLKYVLRSGYQVVRKRG
jgi:nitrate reductase gamma subunit